MDFSALSKTDLFGGCTPQEAESILKCLKAAQKAFSKGEIIYHAEDTVTSLGMVLEGRVLIENDDLWGNTSILDSAGPGQIFAETYACLPEERLMINVVAAEASNILFLNVSQLLRLCPRACTYHSRIISNLLSISAQKNLNLSRRIFHTAPKSIRGRLLSYLSHEAVQNGSRDFTIPFNRQQLASYLSVDRSALSSELSKMQREGLLKVEKNHFYLIRDSLSFH